MITLALIVLAVLAYLGTSLVMLASAAGIAVALWLADAASLARRAAWMYVGALAGSMAAELVHVLHHAALGDQPGHGGFWVSAFLVGSINAVAILVVLGGDHLLRGRARAPRGPGAAPDRTDGNV